MPHECQYAQQTLSRIVAADGLTWQVERRAPLCSCGREQPTRSGFPRPDTRRTSQPGQEPIPQGQEFEALASRLLSRTGQSTRWETLLGTVGARIGSDDLRAMVLTLSRAGAVSLEERWQNRWVPWAIAYVDRDRLEDTARPGRRNEVTSAIEATIPILPDTDAGNLLRDVLQAPPRDWDADTIRIAAAVVLHGAQNRRSLIRTFSTQVGDSKLVEKHERRVERVLGPLGEYGIRRIEDQLLVAGHGVLAWSDLSIPLRPGHGALGIERSRLRDLVTVEATSVLFIENKQAFVAAVEGLVPVPEDALFVYMGGNFGSTIGHMLKCCQGRVFVWADLDPFGVGFVRRAIAIRGDASPWMMDATALESEAAIPLSNTHMAALEREKEQGGVLQDLLLAMENLGVVLEQEGQAHGSPS